MSYLRDISMGITIVPQKCTAGVAVGDNAHMSVVVTVRRTLKGTVIRCGAVTRLSGRVSKEAERKIQGMTRNLRIVIGHDVRAAPEMSKIQFKPGRQGMRWDEMTPISFMRRSAGNLER